MKHSVLRDSLLSGAFVSLVVLASPIRAQDAGQKLDIQLLPPIQGKSYDMPAGDFSAEVKAEAAARLRLVPRRTLNPDQLKQIKAAPGAPATSDRAATAGNQAQANAVTLKCATNSSTNFAPSDIHGAVTPNRLVVVTNVQVGVYNKADCSQVSLKGLRGFFRAAFTIPDTQTLFDPQVIYDESSQRCFLSAESEDSGNTDQYQYFAVSKSSGCNSWYLYRVVLSEVALGTLTCKAAASDFWDYPKNGSVSANGGRWFITANLFPTSGTATSRWLFIDKTPTLTGAAPVIGCVSGAQINTIPPLVKDTNATAYFLSPGSNSSSAVQRYIHVASPTGIASDTASGTTAITIPSWTAPPAAPQPNGVTLDTIDGRFQGQTQQIGTSLWNVHAINVGGFSRIRLYQFSTTGTSPLFTFTPTTVAGNNDHLFNPSVAVNAASNLAFMSVSRTIPMDVTNGKAAMLVLRGPSNSTSGWVTNIVKISNTQFTGCTECRWGDYSATQLDPSNPTRAWGFNQIVTGSSQYNWSTRAAKVN